MTERELHEIMQGIRSPEQVSMTLAEFLENDIDGSVSLKFFRLSPLYLRETPKQKHLRDHLGFIFEPTFYFQHFLARVKGI